MLTDLNSGIAIDTSQCDTVHDTLIDTAECRAAFAAELQTKSMLSNVRRQQVFTGYPGEFFGIDQGVS